MSFNNANRPQKKQRISFLQEEKQRSVGFENSRVKPSNKYTNCAAFKKVTPEKISVAVSNQIPSNPQVSILKPRTKDIGIQVESLPAANTVVIKEEYPKGSIVSINGYHMDHGRYKKRSEAPIFYGCVEDPKDWETYGANDMKECESIISWVIAGEYEWLDKNHNNVFRGKYDHSVLTLCYLPPTDLNDTEPLSEDDITRWFKKTPEGWRVREHEGPCYGCGSPWCLVQENRKAVNALIENVRTCKGTSMREKRYRCYRAAISNKYGTLGYQQRKSPGWCLQNKCRVAFPDSEFTGYQAVNSIIDIDDENLYE